MPAMEVILYDLSQLRPNFSQAGFFTVPTTLLKTRSLGANDLDFTPLSCPYLSFC